MFQQVILIGNLGKDAEVKTVNENVKVATVSLATSEKYNDKDNQLQEKTEWHSVVAWRNNAERIEKLQLKKGDLLQVVGKLSTRKYTDANGVDRYVTEVVVDTFQLLGRKES